jgi:hypothetical protein
MWRSAVPQNIALDEVAVEPQLAGRGRAECLIQRGLAGAAAVVRVGR